MPDPALMRLTYRQLVSRKEKAEAACNAADAAARQTSMNLRAWGRERFIRALAKRGIRVKETLVVYRGTRSTSHSRAIPDAAAIILLVGDVSPPSPSHNHWWFTLRCARQKKCGGFRDEWLFFAAHGETPEKAAATVGAWNA